MGKYNRASAERLLEGKPTGPYIVRESETDTRIGSYTLSVRCVDCCIRSQASQAYSLYFGIGLRDLQYNSGRFSDQSAVLNGTYEL